MHVGFMVPLVMGITGGYISKKWDNEFTYLIGAIAAICLLTSLIIAPLPIHIIILLFVLIITNKLLWINSCRLNQLETEKSEKLDAVTSSQIPSNFQASHLFKYRGAVFLPNQRSKKADLAPSSDFVNTHQTHSTRKYRGSNVVNSSRK